MTRLKLCDGAFVDGGMTGPSKARDNAGKCAAGVVNDSQARGHV